MLAAYRKACSEVVNVQSQFRSRKSQEFLVVRCGEFRPHGPTRAIRVVYTGETVPRLIGGDDHGLRDLGAMLDLRISERFGHAPNTVDDGTVLSQRPAPGTVVPAQTRVRVLVAR
jgi:hypothetical protein